MGRYSLVLLLVACFSCATYYQINQEFNTRFENGELASAEKYLKKNKTKRTKFLYLANAGVVNAMEEDYPSSNYYLEKAYIYAEDYRKNPATVVASFLVNPNVVPYQAEDHEQLMLLYYKALNFLKTNDYESALVECRRLNQLLYELSDKYKSDRKYKRDAFIHNLMGIIYEASGDVNNAFVAYRNAYNIYQEDYHRLFGLEPPEQLKKDLLRVTYLNGYATDLDKYEHEFGMKYSPSKADGELVFFWHNGLGPVKSEWSLNFVVQDGGNGFVTFADNDLGLTFPFATSGLEASEANGLKDLRVLRVAFPKYEERKPTYTKGFITSRNQRYQLNLGEDINKVAFKTLEERMIKELGLGLLRVGLKKVAENQLREESEGWGAVLGVVNAITERADTRNWQTLPHSIYYTRVPLNKGNNEIRLDTMNPTTKSGNTESFNFLIKAKGQTVFHTFRSL